MTTDRELPGLWLPQWCFFQMCCLWRRHDKACLLQGLYTDQSWEHNSVQSRETLGSARGMRHIVLYTCWQRCIRKTHKSTRTFWLIQPVYWFIKESTVHLWTCDFYTCPVQVVLQHPGLDRSLSPKRNLQVKSLPSQDDTVLLCDLGLFVKIYYCPWSFWKNVLRRIDEVWGGGAEGRAQGHRQAKDVPHPLSYTSRPQRIMFHFKRQIVKQWSYDELCTCQCSIW